MKIEAITDENVIGMEVEPYPKLPEEIPIYGTSDHPKHINEKIKSRIRKLSEDTGRKFHIEISMVFKKNQPESQGWRWSKWGKYIGETERQAECNFIN